jgi:Fe-S-cluster containining protein
MSKRDSFLPRTPQVVQLFRRASSRDRTVIGEMHKYYEHSFAEARKDNDFTPEGLAAGIHDATDRAVNQMLATNKHAKRIVCKKGCAACCYQQVTITRDEAELLALVARDARIDIDRERLQRQAEHRGIKPYATMGHDDKACVFLGAENECRVYEYRPVACRKYFVADTAEYCDLEKHPKHQVVAVTAIEAEVMLSAALATTDSGPMATMLLEVLK